MKRDIIEIRSRDYWFKIVEMLQQNWALIDMDPMGSCVVYFLHDGSGVFDEIHFRSDQEAQSQLKQNGFHRYADAIKAQSFIDTPKPPFYKDSHPNGPIYSSGRYWSHSTSHSQGAHKMFKIGCEYTRDEIHKQLGGSKRSYLPTVSGHVVAACLKPELNPRAPNVVLCGNGPIIASAGIALSKQHDPLPVFIKRGIKRWEYRGNFKVIASYSSGPEFEALVAGSGRNPSEVSLAIRLA